jgi:inorganic pyrophosphatase
LNPIKQDTKDGRLRYVSNIFPAKGYPWNYGALPQTWEDPNVEDEHVEERGDSDPLDIIEIGDVKKRVGEVYQAKVLGCLGLIDGGECDWKIVVIDLRDRLSEKIHDTNDIGKYFPELIEFSRKWRCNYKLPEGKERNRLASKGKLFEQDFTLKVIEKCHQSWKSTFGNNTALKESDPSIVDTIPFVERGERVAKSRRSYADTSMFPPALK